jgi:GT2 family glycosyltransferase
MNQTLIRRLGMTRGLWHLLRYQSRLFRWSSVDARSAVGRAADARWLGNTQIGRRSHHALFTPPGSAVAFRFWAPRGARIVTWCGVIPGTLPAHSSAAFTVTVRTEGAAADTETARLRLEPDRSSSDRRWRRLVVDLHHHEAAYVEVRLSIDVTQASAEPCAVWGEPRIEWRRPVREITRLVRDVSALVARGQLLAAARIVHGRLSASSHPSTYQMWLSQHATTEERLQEMRTQSEAFAYRPLVSVVTPVYNTDARWLRACVESVRRQAYPHWQLCLADDGSTRQETRDVLRELAGDSRIAIHTLPSNAGIAAASNAALALATGEFVAFLDHDDEIPPEALFEVVSHLNRHQDADFIYSDEDKLEPDGTRAGVYFKPDWSHEHFLTNMYTCHLMVVRRTLLEKIGGFRVGYDGAQDYDLVLRLMDQTSRIHHLPKVLYHWRKIPESTAGREDAKPAANDAGRRALEDHVRRNELDAEILPGVSQYVYRVRFAIRGEPLISIILPAAPGGEDADARGRACARTIRTLIERTSYRRLEVLMPVQAGGHEAIAGVAQGLHARVVPVDATQFRDKRSRLAAAAAAASGEHLLFMDWGLRALDGDWLTALLEFSQQEAIGVVGAKLHYPDGTLKHIGIVLGVNGAAAPALHRHPRSSMGYWGTAISARNYSAVSGECMMTRREVYERVGGLDPEMGRYADVDYCLRVTAAGYRVVFTPHAALVHDAEPSPAAEGESSHDASRLRRRWADRLARDPFYNPNLSRNSPDYDPDLAGTR